MKKSYEEPQLLVRKYLLPLSDVITTSDLTTSPNDLDDGDDHNYFG